MAVRPIDANELYRIEKLLDTDVVRQSKTASWLLDQVLHDIQAMPTLTPPNEPLTVEQLQQMDGRPAYWLDDESWGIISVDDSGRWAGIPFFRGRKNGVNFEFDIESRGMEVYAQQPAHIDREKWGPCENCEEKLCENCQSIHFASWEKPCKECAGKSNWQPASKYCPWCGRPLTDEAWAELERRVFGEV